MARILAVSSGLVLAPEPVLLSDVPRKGFNRPTPSGLHWLVMTFYQSACEKERFLVEQCLEEASPEYLRL